MYPCTENFVLYFVLFLSGISPTGCAATDGGAAAEPAPGHRLFPPPLPGAPPRRVGVLERRHAEPYPPRLRLGRPPARGVPAAELHALPATCLPTPFVLTRRLPAAKPPGALMTTPAPPPPRNCACPSTRNCPIPGTNRPASWQYWGVIGGGQGCAGIHEPLWVVNGEVNHPPTSTCGCVGVWVGPTTPLPTSRSPGFRGGLFWSKFSLSGAVVLEERASAHHCPSKKKNKDKDL